MKNEKMVQTVLRIIWDENEVLKEMESDETSGFTPQDYGAFKAILTETAAKIIYQLFDADEEVKDDNA